MNHADLHEQTHGHSPNWGGRRQGAGRVPIDPDGPRQPKGVRISRANDQFINHERDTKESFGACVNRLLDELRRLRQPDS